MHFFNTLFAALLPLSVLGLALPAPSTPELEKRYTYLAQGTSYTSGAISSTLRWQSSGALTIGGCNAAIKISTCYPSSFTSTNYLAPTGMYESSASDNERRSLPNANEEQLDARDLAIVEEESGLVKRQELGRQRIEFLSWPGTPAGQTWTYKWSSYIFSGFTTNAHFLHTWQLLRRDGSGGPVLTLDYKVGLAVLGDTVRKCVACVTAPLSSFEGKVILHTLKVTYGPSGSAVYKAVDQASGKTLISYSASGDMGSNGSIKFGLYRPVYPGVSALHALVGDYSAVRS
ncbi:hypothetical protein T439DRAFT_359644 [Meredithblackwellia eburnea MCA 4105]